MLLVYLTNSLRVCGFFRIGMRNKTNLYNVWIAAFPFVLEMIRWSKMFSFLKEATVCQWYQLCVDRESKPEIVLGRHQCYPLHHRRHIKLLWILLSIHLSKQIFGKRQIFNEWWSPVRSIPFPIPFPCVLIMVWCWLCFSTSSRVISCIS